MTTESALLSSIRQLMASRYSSRYSTSSISSFSATPLRPRLHSQFGEESSISSITDAFSRYHGDTLDESSWAESAGGCQAPGGSGVGVVRATGDSYFLSADVSGFEPHEVVLLVYNQCVAIHAEKMAADGSVAGRFTHKSVLPADMDPLSVSSSLTAERRLIISVGRRKSPVTSDL
ncbi:heat shock protein beta-7-like [Sinocyclocheilus grahami]|uniref:heat shock protein beta-7-like n=1 Tax=Sinocyclocheilus grahami TaxID=75366 RepID=UPI0007AD1C36|nr:PREDICTED: heat shock protein beta-7-like [Sinocyclocheilus grahami]